MRRVNLRAMLIPLLTAGVFASSAAVVFWLALVHTVHLGTVAVPDLAGLPSEEAETIIHDVGLVLELDVRGVFSSAVEAGRIAAQDPLPGFHLKTGSRVVARLSMGGEVVIVPDLAGESLPTAQRQLEQLGLRPAAEELRIHGQAEGEVVVAAAPPAGAVVPPGTELRLLVNATPRRALWVMPSMVSMPVSSVRHFCRLHHVRLGHVHEVRYPGLQRGTVLRQYPQAGSPLSRSDIITVWVSQ